MKRCGIWASLVVIGLASIAVWYEPILVNTARWLNVGGPPRQADYVMVLPGGSEQRPFIAVAMIHAGLAQGVLTAETETDAANDEGLNPTTDAVLRKILLIRGIREDQIHVLPGRSNSTWTDALSLANFMQQHPQATIAIVTHDYHTRRSRWVFERVLGAAAHRVFFVSAPVDRFNERSWWKTEEGLTNYLSEYAKLGIYVGSDQKTIAVGVVIAVAIAIGFQRRRIWRSQTPNSTEAPSSSADATVRDVV